MNQQILNINLLFQNYKDALLVSTKDQIIRNDPDLKYYTQINPSLSELFNKSFSKMVKPFSFSFRQKEIDAQNDVMRNLQDEQNENSVTLSLSFIKEQQQQQYFTNSLDWQSVLNQYGRLFRPFSDQKTYIQTSKFNNILNNTKGLLIDQGYDTKIYSGTNQNEWIVLREQLVGNKSLLESAQQYIIHNQIYKLYPKIFLQLLLPVYVKIDQFEKVRLISQLEYGEINLYDYSQQNTIKDLEYYLIFQQLYEQITLLHNHNIAHRDIKPQNVIFVENKGWVLCDFGDSIIYENNIGIYGIRGTFAFLRPQLQQQSKIQGIMLQQNLIQNDIYALAITMIVIKYQIKYQIDLKDYLLKDDDPLINKLLNATSLEQLEKIQNKYELRYIRPQIISQKQQTMKQIDIEEVCSYIAILQNTDTLSKLTDELKVKIITLIDQKLQLRDKYYNSINHGCYLCLPQYLKQLKNLIKYSELRQVNYWKRKMNVDDDYKMIIFMDTIGLTEKTFQYAKYFLEKNYDFTIHIIVIKNLLLFQEIDQAKQEFYQIIRFREFKQMTEEQLHLLIEVTLNLFPWDMISAEDILYCEQLGIQASYCDWSDTIREDNNNDEFLDKSVKFIQQCVNSRKDKKLPIGRIFEYIQSAFQQRNIKTSLDLIYKVVQPNLKYFCTTYHWCKLKQYEINMLILLENNRKELELLKKINYILLFNSESQQQQQILRLLKLNVFLNLRIYNQQKQYKILILMQKMVQNNKQFSFQYYNLIFIEEILEILFNLYYQNSIFRYYRFALHMKFQIKNYWITQMGKQWANLQYLKILILILKGQLLQYLNLTEQTTFMIFITQYYLDTNNNNRFKQMLINKNQQRSLEIQYGRMGKIIDMKKLLNLKNYEQTENAFLVFQFLEKI